MNISEKTLEELEFHVIRTALAEHCNFDWSRKIAQQLTPLKSTKKHKEEYLSAKEMHACISNSDGLPSFSVDEIDQGLKELSIPGYQVHFASFIVFLDTVNAFYGVKQFFGNREEVYPFIFQKISNISYQKEIKTAITKIFGPDGEVRSNASPALFEIRQMLAAKNQELHRHFQSALSSALSSEHLAETRESIQQGKRVLSVLSERKKFVKGRVLGISKTGKITYIEPEQTIECSNDIVFLENQELNEIARILQQLSEEIRPYADDLRIYHQFLSWLDLVRAKAQFAFSYKGVIPEVNYQNCNFELKKAYHPVLWLKAKNKSEIIPQTVSLEKTSRFLVISGPNAGGKSISLKTVGLLQCMMQSGLLIPVEEGSKMGWFQQILSDIGDNQSIDNELSTYSYRLKQMRYFLEKANPQTLILIDEFGSGSDPELGGALAEVCLKELYNSHCFAVLTTHYGNIKVLVDALPEAQNGSMLFNMDTLSPKYQLSIGNAGSSFTFEVAQKMGISKKMLHEARGKVNSKKVKLDQSLSKVQHYESELKTQLRSYQVSKLENKQATEDLNLRSDYYEKQYEQLQELLENNDKFIKLGRRFTAFIESYPGEKKNEAWLKTITNYVIKERVNIAEKLKHEKKKAAPVTKIEKNTLKDALKEEVKPLLKKASANKVKPKKTEVIKKVELGSTVRILGSATTGKVLEINKKQATVQIGAFVSKVALDKLTAV